MTILSFEKLNEIIKQSPFVKSNYDVNEIIYNFYKKPEPKYKINESCIRNYNDGKKQLVNIDSLTYNIKDNSYYYFYSYYHSSDGYCSEKNLRKLTNSENELMKESIFRLPMDMCSWNNNY